MNRTSMSRQELRDGLCNFGLVSLACKIDFAYFLCVARILCTYNKTTIHLTRLFIFFEFLRIFGSPKRAPVTTNVSALIYHNFQDKLNKNE